MGLRDDVLKSIPKWAKAFTVLSYGAYEKLGLSELGLRNQLETGICLRLREILMSQGSDVFLNVKGVRFPIFDTDIDVLELRDNGEVVAYGVKGIRTKRKGGDGIKVLDGPGALEGADQALNDLLNGGYTVDYAYLVHPAIMFHGYIIRTAITLSKTTPLGYIIVTLTGELAELVKPKHNPLIKYGKHLSEISENDLLGVNPEILRAQLEKEISKLYTIPINYTPN